MLFTAVELVNLEKLIDRALRARCEGLAEAKVALDLAAKCQGLRASLSETKEQDGDDVSAGDQ